MFKVHPKINLILIKAERKEQHTSPLTLTASSDGSFEPRILLNNHFHANCEY